MKNDLSRRARILDLGMTGQKLDIATALAELADRERALKIARNKHEAVRSATVTVEKATSRWLAEGSVLNPVALAAAHSYLQQEYVALAANAAEQQAAETAVTEQSIVVLGSAARLKSLEAIAEKTRLAMKHEGERLIGAEISELWLATHWEQG